MDIFLDQFKKKVRYLDWVSLIWMGIFILVGYLFIYSATLFEFSQTMSVINARGYLSRQVVSTFLGLVGALIFFVLPEKWVKNKKIIWFINGMVIFLLFITNFFGNTVGGSTNWLSIGPLTFQPSELVKISMPFLFAWYWTYEGDYSLLSLWLWTKGIILSIYRQISGRQPSKDNQEVTETHKQNQSTQSFSWTQSDWPFLLLSLGLTFVSLAMMPDYGMILVLLLTLGMVYVYIHYSLKRNLLLFGVGTLLYGLLIQVAPSLVGNYIFDRVRVISNPFLEAQGNGYQLVRALLALSSGGLWGQGILRGPIKAQSLPASHTDFIFAVMGEEIGIIGLGIFMAFYLYFIIRLMMRAYWLVDPFRRYIAMVFPFIILIQAIINIGGVLSLVPLTGLTLPFISYGGTSIIVMTLCMGIYQYMVVTDAMDQELSLTYQKKDEESPYGI